MKTTFNEHFIYDNEKMQDFKTLTKEEFLKSYSYLSAKEYDNTKLLIDIVQNLSDFVSKRVNETKLSFTNKQEILELVIHELENRV